VIGQQLHAYLRAAAGYERTTVGPFLATFTAGNSHPNRNYAVPEDGIDPTPAEIAALVALYEDRGLRPRLEYASSAAPALGPALRAAGFTTEATIPILTCEPGQQCAVAISAVTVVDAADDKDHQDAWRVAGIAYGEPFAPVPDWVSAARSAMVAAGGAVAIARDTTTGEAIGTGLYQAPIEDMIEVAAVGTLPGRRQLGVATAVISHLATRAFGHGVQVAWLTAENDAERHAAEHAGFRDTGEVMVHVSRPT
jgi:GNAT superfamily N-acetyltransferase